MHFLWRPTSGAWVYRANTGNGISFTAHRKPHETCHRAAQASPHLTGCAAGSPSSTGTGVRRRWSARRHCPILPEEGSVPTLLVGPHICLQTVGHWWNLFFLVGGKVERRGAISWWGVNWIIGRVSQLIFSVGASVDDFFHSLSDQASRGPLSQSGDESVEAGRVSRVDGAGHMAAARWKQALFGEACRLGPFSSEAVKISCQLADDWETPAVLFTSCLSPERVGWASARLSEPVAVSQSVSQSCCHLSAFSSCLQLPVSQSRRLKVRCSDGGLLWSKQSSIRPHHPPLVRWHRRSYFLYFSSTWNPVFGVIL